LGIGIVIYFSLAAVLVLVGVPRGGVENEDENGLSFEELFIDYTDLPNLQSYTARDGAQLNYRYYPADTADRVLILLHGSGWHSQYFLNLADTLSSQNIAHIYTPDLRGHGENPIRRGDVDYIDQYEDDLADFIRVIRTDHPNKSLIMGGHSSGGGLALRFGGSQYGNQVDAYLLLAPFLKHNAPTARKDSGGWAVPFNGRIAGLSMLNNIGIRVFNHLEVIRFNMPIEARDGTETLSYTYRLNTAYHPENYKKDLAAIQQPLLVLIGTADEAFLPEQYEPTVTKHNPAAQVELLPGVNHNGIVVGDDVQPIVSAWLQSLD
jgi:alpha-beta hydrolase superfamily lysophospholipase